MKMADKYESGTYWEKNSSYHEEDAGFKTGEAIAMLEKHNISPESIIDIGCGSGKNLNMLASHFDCRGLGVDVSPQAISRADSLHKTDKITFECNKIQNIDVDFDLAVMFDVFEHVDDYIGFLRGVNNIARSFIFNIPLDMNVNTILRDRYMWARQEVGHIHYFTERSALATLEYCDYRITDSSLTNSYVHAVKTKPTLKGFVAFLPRFTTSIISRSFSEKLFGGSSLLVLTEQPPDTTG